MNSDLLLRRSKENPRTYTTTGGFELTLPTGLGDRGTGEARLACAGCGGLAEELPQDTSPQARRWRAE
jgi:hypothetical protein